MAAISAETNSNIMIYIKPLTQLVVQVQHGVKCISNLIKTNLASIAKVPSCNVYSGGRKIEESLSRVTRLEVFMEVISSYCGKFSGILTTNVNMQSFNTELIWYSNMKNSFKELN